MVVDVYVIGTYIIDSFHVIVYLRYRYIPTMKFKAHRFTFLHSHTIGWKVAMLGLPLLEEQKGPMLVNSVMMYPNEI